MKYLLLLTVLFTATISHAQDQEYRIGTFYEGYIVNNDGERVRGYIQYLAESQRYEKVIFKEDKNGKKSKFTPKKIKGYKVAGVEYRSCNFKAVIMRDTKFLAVGKDGCMEMMSWRKYNNADRAWEGEIVLRVNGEAVSTQTFVMGFAKRMSALIKDNEELYNKVKNKQKGYRLLSLEAIVDEYNEQCEE